MNGRTMHYAVLAVLIFVWPAGAANYNDATNGNWTDVATWGGGGYPASTADNATLDSHTVTLDAPLTINNLYLNYGNLDTAGYTLTVQGIFTNLVGATTGNGKIIADGVMICPINANPGPSNSATLDVHGGSIFGATSARKLQNNGVINFQSGTFTNNAATIGSSTSGTGVWNIAAGAVLLITTSGSIAGMFNNSGLVVASNGTWTSGNGANSGAFSGLSFGFSSGATFLPGSSITASNLTLSGGTSIFQAGSAFSAYGLADMSGQITMESSNTCNRAQFGVAGVWLDGAATLTSTGMLTIMSGTLSGSGKLLAQGGLTIYPNPASISNTRPITVHGGGLFQDSLNSGRRFTNLGRIELEDGEFGVTSGQANLFLGSGTLYIGPSATFHRYASATAMTHENPTTNAGTIKASTGTINFTGGMTQTATGALMGNGGTLNGTLTITGGEIAPGANTGEAGALNLSGTVNMSSAARMAIELGGTTATNEYDLLKGGTINLNGCGLDVAFINGFKNSVNNSNTFTVIRGTLIGSFENLTAGRVTADNGGTFQVTVTTGAGGSVVLSDYQYRAHGMVVIIQ